jgi:hypothetical protein
MICSSLNLLRFIVQLQRWAGLYPNLEETAGLRPLAEQAEFLAACSVSFNHFTYPPAEGLEGAALFRKAYEDPTIGFIAAQVAAHINDWANFTTSSAAS